MSQNIFEFQDYKTYLRERAKRSGRGFKKSLAEASQCQTTYISQVLGGNSHLSLEQAQASCDFLGLNREEAYYFLLLVERSRAGTKSLQLFLEDRIQGEREKHLLIRERLKLQNSLTPESRAQYYSSWQYAAVHMLLTIPGFRTPSKISKRLTLPLPRVHEILSFLVSVGLAQRSGEDFIPGVSQIFLEKFSPLISKHHSNWRLKAMASLDDNHPDAIHFSSVFTLTEEAIQKVRAILTQAIEDSVDIVKEAKEEKMIAVTLDLFEI